MNRQTTIAESFEVEGINVFNGKKNYIRFDPSRDYSGFVEMAVAGMH